MRASETRQTLIGPDFIVAAESRHRGKPLELRKRLAEPSLDTLREPGRLCDELLRFFNAALFFVRSSKQEQGFAIAAEQLQRLVQILRGGIQIAFDKARVSHVEKRIACKRIHACRPLPCGN